MPERPTPADRLASAACDDVPEVRRRIMRANRRRDSAPEIAVRSALHRMGLRYRVDRPIKLPGLRPIRPDIVFGAAQLAVFIDGCFWHGCPVHGTQSATRPEYWGAKIAENQARDRRQIGLLESAGWRVIRVWEHEPPAEAAERIQRMLGRQ